MEWKRMVKAALALTLISPGIAAAESAGRARLVVRVYDAVGLPNATLRGALAEAVVVLGDGGVDVSWTRCAAGGPNPADCDHPVVDHELVVRLTTSPKVATARMVTMGFALIQPEARHSVMASIYWDRVLAVASDAHVDPRPLLGRAVAHEIGHLLLNTNSHARQGLMRAMWSQAELRRDTPAYWRWDEGEAQAIHASLTESR